MDQVKNLIQGFGRLPRTALNMGLILAAGLLEGFGIALFIPIIDSLISAEAARAGYLETYLGKLGIDIGTVGSATLFIFATMLIVLSFSVAYVQQKVAIQSKYLYLRLSRRKLLSSLLHTNWSYLSNQGTGEHVSRFLIETDQACDALYFQLLFVSSFIQILVLVGIALTFSWQLVALALVTSAAVILITFPLYRRAKFYGAETVRRTKAYTLRISDYLSGVKLVKAMALEDRVLNEISAYSDRQCEASVDKQLNSARVMFTAQVAPVLFMAFIIAVAFLYLDIEVPVVAAFAVMVVRLAPRVAQFQQYIEGFVGRLPSLRLADDLLRKTSALAENREGRTAQFEKLKSDIRLDGASLSYETSHKAALDHVSIVVPKGSTVALVGESGSGKSSVVDLICGLWTPTSGRVLVDGIDLQTIDIASWRRSIGYVTQSIVVFNDTLRNNMLLARSDSSDSDIIACLGKANLTAFVQALPDGLDTVLGEGGSKISGGQRQRLALARALLADPDVLILDEATNALDAETTRVVHRVLDDLAEPATRIIVTHDLSTIEAADQIYVFDAGCVAAFGSHDELSRSSPLYRKLRSDLDKFIA